LSQEDHTLAVAFYDSETSNEPASVELTWAELVQTLTSDTPAPCTAETCVGKKCPHKSRAGDDPGAWSPVQIEGLRDNSNVRAVTALVLDGDGITAEQVELVSQALQGRVYALHTTHRHRTTPYFIRLVLELARPVLAHEWASFYPRSIAYLGLTGIFDPTCKDLSRLYFLPTRPSDIPFLCDVGTGASLDVDAILSRSPSIQQIPALGTAQASAADRQEECDLAPDAEQGDFVNLGTAVKMLSAYRRARSRGTDIDKEKSDLVGRLLSGKPLAAPGGNAEATPIAPPEDLPKGRGHAIMRAAAILTGYLPADVPDEVYLEIFSRSFDAMCFGRVADRDEMVEHLLEKVRIGRDRRKEWDAELATKNTSAKAYQVAIAETRLKARAAREKVTELKDGVQLVEETAAPPPDGDDWLTQLRHTKDGEGLIASGLNAYLILRNESEFRGALRWNEVTLSVDAFGIFANAPAASLYTHIGNYLALKWGLTLKIEAVAQQIELVAQENAYDPIKEYLRSLKWDGESRLSDDGGWLVRYAHAIPGPMVESVGRKWAVGAVARGLEPGTKNDTVLILEGPQGRRKTMLFETLGKQWYADMSIVIGDKDSKMIAGRSWICEIPDLAALKRSSEVNAVKAFFSTRADTFRPPFGRHVITSPRRNAFGGTTNEEQYLVDPTGNRRFLCIKLEDTDVDIKALDRDRDQIWAEAVYLYDKHVNECEDKLHCGCWWFVGDEKQKLADMADERLQESPNEIAIEEWWYAIEPKFRPKHLTGNFIAKEILKFTQDRITRSVLIEIGFAIKKLGFRRERDGSGTRAWVYLPTEEMLTSPQSDLGKAQASAMKFKPKVVSGGG